MKGDGMTLEIVRFEGNLVSRAIGWLELETGERKRRAVQAARDRDAATLWSLTEANLTRAGRAGANVSPHTLETYEVGVRQVLDAATGVSVLAPPRDWGSAYRLRLEGKGASAATVRVKLAAARALFAALRWAGATEADPFSDVKARKDPTPAWEKRAPYPLEAVERLLERAKPREAVLILLTAHAGLRIGEACRLRVGDVDLEARSLRVQDGKGGKARTVSLSTRLVQALEGVKLEPNDLVIGIAEHGARAALKRLCARAGVMYRAAHSFRHTAGTRLYEQTGDLNRVAAHLGHASLETSRVYAHMNPEKLRNDLEHW
jgi:integrase